MDVAVELVGDGPRQVDLDGGGEGIHLDKQS